MADLLLAAVVLRRPEHALAAQVLALVLRGVLRVADDAPPVLEVVDPDRAAGHEPEVLTALLGAPPERGRRVRLDPDDAALRDRLAAGAARAQRVARHDGYVEPGRPARLTEKGQALRADLVALEDAVEREVAAARARDADHGHVSVAALPWAVLFGHDAGWVPVDRRSVRVDVAALCAAVGGLRPVARR